MLTKTTHSSKQLPVSYMYGVKNSEEIFVVFRENAVRAKEIALWRYKDVLLDVELLHAQTWVFALNCSV